MATTVDCTTTAAPTVYAAAYALRNKLLSGADTQDAAGALTFLITAAAALQSRAARLAARPQPTPPAPAAGFAPIARVAIFDELVAAVDYARGVAPAGAWLNAVEKAWGWLLEQECYHFDAEHRALRIPSASEPGKVYEANGQCQCRAHEVGSPCYHRCASRLIARALDLRERAARLVAEGVAPARALAFASADMGWPIRPLAVAA